MLEMKNSSQIILALMVSSGFFFCIFFMLNKEFPAANKDALNSLLGVLTTIFTLIMNFFFGSSSSSKQKDETIGAIATDKPPVKSVTIPNAEAVTVKTESGDVNLTQKEK